MKNIQVRQTRIESKHLLIGLCLGLLVRLGMLWFIDYRFDHGDAVGYLQAGRNLIDFHIFSPDASSTPVSSFYRPPFYSVFVGVVMYVFGQSILALQLSQMVVSLISAVLMSKVLERVFPKAMFWIFYLMMLLPFEAVYTGAALSETLTSFLLIASTFSIVCISGAMRWVLGGALLGLCVLTRDIYMPLIPLVGMTWLFVSKKRGIPLFVDLVVLAVSACFVILPWTYRNYHLEHRLIPVSEGRLGYSMWTGTWATNGDFIPSNEHLYPPEAFRSPIEEVRVNEALELFSKDQTKKSDAIFKTLALQRIRDEPIRVLKTFLIRAPKLWLGTRFDIFQLNSKWFPRGSPIWVGIKIVLWVLNALLMGLALFGMLVSLRKKEAVGVLALPILFTAGVYFPLNSFENRYSLPVYPFVLVFSTAAIFWLIDKLKLQKNHVLSRFI